MHTCYKPYDTSSFPCLPLLLEEHPNPSPPLQSEDWSGSQLRSVCTGIRVPRQAQVGAQSGSSGS